jgi:hypothetical protein
VALSRGSTGSIAALSDIDKAMKTTAELIMNAEMLIRPYEYMESSNPIN